MLNRLGMNFHPTQKSVNPKTNKPSPEETSREELKECLPHPGPNATREEGVAYLKSWGIQPMTEWDRRLAPLRHPLWTLEKAWDKIKPFIGADSKQFWAQRNAQNEFEDICYQARKTQREREKNQ
jgi:hypothetical protein